jgi:hypothetical protein
MNTGTKLYAYITGLGLVFAGAIWAGRVAGPAARTTEGPAHEGMSGMTRTTGPTHASSDHDAGTDGAAAPKGLAVSQDGYTLTPVTTSLPAGTKSAYAFRIVGPDGRPVTDYRPTHDRKLHLIVVRRDLSGFAHVHPTIADDGTWSVPLQLTEAGSYRVFADFAPAGQSQRPAPTGCTWTSSIRARSAPPNSPRPPAAQYDHADHRRALRAQPLTSNQPTNQPTNHAEPIRRPNRVSGAPRPASDRRGDDIRHRRHDTAGDHRRGAG